MTDVNNIGVGDKEYRLYDTFTINMGNSAHYGRLACRPTWRTRLHPTFVQRGLLGIPPLLMPIPFPPTYTHTMAHIPLPRRCPILWQCAVLSYFLVYPHAHSPTHGTMESFPRPPFPTACASYRPDPSQREQVWCPDAGG